MSSAGAVMDGHGREWTGMDVRGVFDPAWRRGHNGPVHSREIEMMRVPTPLPFLLLSLGACLSSAAQGPHSGDAELVALTQSEYTSLDDFADRLARLKDALDARDDPRAVFAAMYVVLTDNGAAAIARGDFKDGAWVAAFMVAFGNLYRQAFYDYETGRLDRVPPPWIVTFDAAKDNSVTVFQHALLGIHAHINRDVPYAIAEVTPLRDRVRRFPDFARTNAFVVASIDVVEDAVVAYDADLGNLDELLQRADEKLLKRVLSFWRYRAWARAGTVRMLGAGPALDCYGALLDEFTRRQAVWARDSDALFALGDAGDVSKLCLTPELLQGPTRGLPQPVLVEMRDGRVFEIDFD